jgi:lysophospholipase L1-like esterase
MKIKKMAPGISIIVLGVSDVDQKKGDSLETNPNVEIIREAQRKAAFRAGCAFWDVFKAMGGRNSMAAWVAHKPELGAADYIHFTPAGANLVAEMFYRALLLEIYSQNHN